MSSRLTLISTAEGLCHTGIVSRDKDAGTLGWWESKRLPLFQIVLLLLIAACLHDDDQQHTAFTVVEPLPESTCIHADATGICAGLLAEASLGT